MSEEIHHPELAAVEQALAALAPRPGALDRDRLMFRAGQAAARPRTWAWPCATAALASLAATLGVALLLRPAPPTIVQYVQVPVERVAPSAPLTQPSPAAPDTAEAAPKDLDGSRGRGDYLKLRNQVLCWGVDALPDLPSPPPLAPPLKLQQLLDLSLDAPEPPHTSSSSSYLKQGEKS